MEPLKLADDDDSFPEAVRTKTHLRHARSHPLAQAWFNYTIAAVIVVVILIPCIFIAIAIKLDSRGPVFFRQPRLGLHNRTFMMWKFRTMYVECSDIAGSQLTMRNDPRITRVGTWLRRWSLDELPQLLNVLDGTMALVGPRPHPLQAKVGDQLYAAVVPGYHHRHAVLPGITGWAQINGWRGETVKPYQIEQRVAHDLEYVAKKSVRFDLQILLLTVVRLRKAAF